MSDDASPRRRMSYLRGFLYSSAIGAPIPWVCTVALSIPAKPIQGARLDCCSPRYAC
jgi:hypothetical protein